MHWHKDYVATLYSNGVASGSEGKFLPNDNVTRAQYSAFLNRSLHPEKTVTPSKPLQSNPIQQQPTPKPTKPPVDKKQPPTAPPGAKFIKEDKANGKKYSYPKELPDGGKVLTVNVDKYSVSIFMTYKNETYVAEYVKSRKLLMFSMIRPDIKQSSVYDLYEIAETFVEYKNKK